MSVTDDLKARWGHNRFDRAMDRSYEAMRPYMHIIETDNGMLAMVIVSIATSAKVLGNANAKDLEAAIQKASSMTSIPAEVLNVYAQSSAAMIEAYQLDQHDSPFV